MDLPKQKIDAVRIERETTWRRDRVEHARKLVALADGEQAKERRAAVLCPVCYIGGTQGGATSTERPCAFCETTLRSGNACVEVLCAKCAAESQLCRRCGADIDLKYRRKRKLPGGA